MLNQRGAAGHPPGAEEGRQPGREAEPADFVHSLGVSGSHSDPGAWQVHPHPSGPLLLPVHHLGDGLRLWPPPVPGIHWHEMAIVLV